MNISIFGPFGWKIPIHAPKIGFFGQFDSLNGLQYQPKPKKCTSLHQSASSKTPAKAGQRNAEIKTTLLTIQIDLLHEFIDKAIVSFCNRFSSCVAATGGHGHCEQSV